MDEHQNIDPKTVAGFGDEWIHFDQASLSENELKEIFDGYFSIFPWNKLPKNAEGFDAGCGSGRWAKLIAPRVKLLHCIEPSNDAIEVARHNLKEHKNCEFYNTSVNSMSIKNASMDFGYCLGVLHHVPDVQAGLSACVQKLKPGAPFLVYIYYVFENRPRWFRFLWSLSNILRRIICRFPSRWKYFTSQILVFLVYLPFARFAWLMEKIGLKVSNFPLSAYRHRSLYVMRTDALDRFGTRLEKRFSRQEIRNMMERSGLERVEFSESMPYWCVMGYRPLVDTIVNRPEKVVVIKSQESCFRIVHIITGLNIGGAETMLCKLLSEMGDKKFSQVVISLMEGGTLKEKIESLNIPVHSLGMKQGIPSLRAVWDLKKLVFKLQPDLLQGWMYHGNIAASLARFLYGKDKVKLLWNIRASMSSFEKRLTYAVINLGARLSRKVDRVIYNSFTSEREHRILNYDTSNSIVISNGFETETFKPDSMARSNIRKELGLQDDTFLVGRIARYHPVKGHVTFLKAAAKILKKKPDIFFLLAGRGINSYNQELQKIIDENDLKERVLLLDERKDIPRLTAALDIAVSSSAGTESFSNVLGEAMSCGVPCVVTDIGDSAIIVGDTGRVVPPKDAYSLACAIESLINVGPEELNRLGKASRKKIINNYSLQTIAKQYEKLYLKSLS